MIWLMAILVFVLWTLFVGAVCYRFGWYRGLDSATVASEKLTEWFSHLDDD